MGVAAAPLMIAGTLVSAGAMVMQGQAQKKIADYNAKRREVAATTERRRGAAEGVVRSQETRRFLAQQIAEINGLGGQIGGVTELEIAEQSARAAELDFLNTLADSEVTATGLEAEARGLRTEGRAARRNAVMGGFARALSGFGQTAMWAGG